MTIPDKNMYVPAPSKYSKLKSLEVKEGQLDGGRGLFSAIGDNIGKILDTTEATLQSLLKPLFNDTLHVAEKVYDQTLRVVDKPHQKPDPSEETSHSL